MAHDHDAQCLCVSEHRPPVSEYHLHHIRPLAAALARKGYHLSTGGTP